MKPKYIFWIGLPITVIALFALFYSGALSRFMASGVGEGGRNYQQIPFDELDAVSKCKSRTRNELGAGLRLLHDNDWSTRWEEKRQLYLVALDAEMTLEHGANTLNVYCYVDPSTYVVTYFKIVDPNESGSSTSPFEAMLSIFQKDKK